MPILETARAVEMLMKFGIGVGGVVVNRVIPEDAGEFFRGPGQFPLQFGNFFGGLQADLMLQSGDGARQIVEFFFASSLSGADLL